MRKPIPISKPLAVLASILLTLLGPTVPLSRAGDFVVYSVYQALDMGNPGEKSPKDYYINMGRMDGLQEGASLDVIRKAATYDLVGEKLYKDILFPIARLKVIHVENTVAVARLDKVLSVQETPATPNRFVMVGDRVELSR